MKNILYLINYFIRRLNIEIRIVRLWDKNSNSECLPKAISTFDRFREIVSDPLNLLIQRVPNAGFVDEKNNVILHNGIRVPIQGKYAYYNYFSDILIINRGVHEPLEEYCFQEILKQISSLNPVMIELGSYWAHYSMWFQKIHPKAVQFLIEPNKTNLKSGRNNFMINGFHGEFINASVGNKGFKLDQFVQERNISQIDLLHSDIQGYELEMLDGSIYSFKNKIIKYLFLSTHSEDLHNDALKFLDTYSYIIEVTSNLLSHTTSMDGFIMARSPDVSPLFSNFNPMGRQEICRALPNDLLNSVTFK